MKKKILITGGGGFIFSNFIRKALYEKINYDLVTVDLCKGHNVLHNIYVNKGHKFYVGDVADSHFIDVVFQVEKPDIVIHGAAESFVDDSLTQAKNFVHSNVLGTQIIIDACLKYKIEKLVYISTDEVYGQLTSESEPSWTELSPTSPRNPYSATKLAGELLVQAAHQTHGLNFNITRSSNNFGRRQHPRNLIPKIIKNVLNDAPVPIYGQGMQMREWIYVEDNCNGIMTVLEKGKPNEIYNISSGYEFTNIEIFQQICNILKKGHNLLTFVKDRPGHDFRYSISSNKLRELGWAPLTKVKQGLEITADWYVNNQWFYK